MSNTMKRRGSARRAIVVVAVLTLLALPAASASAFHDGGPVELNSHEFTWVDPVSGGIVEVEETVFEGCLEVYDTGGSAFHPHDMAFQYTVHNVSFDPTPGITNGFSGFQIRFPQAVPELYNQQSPDVGGPWHQNSYSGLFPPFGAEWDVNLAGYGIMPGETGVFSYCTFERLDVIVEAPDAGWFHTWGIPVPEPIVDADGTQSRFADSGSGFVDVAVLDSLNVWPTGRSDEGLDMFDTDGSGDYTAGDDFHVEDPATHPGAIRDGWHDDFLDPLVLDVDNSLDSTPGAERVSCDLETGTFCAAGFPWDLAWFDSNPDGFWNDGEDIVLDLNGDGIFGSVSNSQSHITYVTNSVPGELLYALDLNACSYDHEVCKKVKYLDHDRDGIIEVGEPVMFLEIIQVHNPTAYPWTDVTVKDRWGAEIDVTSAEASQGIATLTTKGNSAKEFLEWDIGTIPPGGTASLVLMTMTDLNPAGHQSYTSPGDYEYNSGAVLKVMVQPAHAKKPHQESFNTGSVWVTVFE